MGMFESRARAFEKAIATVCFLDRLMDRCSFGVKRCPAKRFLKACLRKRDSREIKSETFMDCAFDKEEEGELRTMSIHDFPLLKR